MVRRRLGIALLLAIAFIVAAGVSGQTAQPAATLDDLLAEVRHLRAEIHDVAAAGIRAQLLTTQLILQAQRIRTLGDHVTAAQNARRAGEADHRARAAHLKQAEDLLRNGTTPIARVGELEKMLARLREEVAGSKRDEEAFRAREQELRDTLSAEERLWVDFSNRLNDLERRLPATR